MPSPDHTPDTTSLPDLAGRTIAFVGGGNMASALIGGLRRQGLPPAALHVVEPEAGARERLAAAHGIAAVPQAGEALGRAALVVWAVKPQTFAAAARAARAWLPAGALHLSVAAGITSGSIARWLQSEHVVRAMPNTPALIGQGMTGLYARPAVAPAARTLVEQVLAPTGRLLWLDDEARLDAVTALSGSGPAYVFYFIEAMVAAGREMGLREADARTLACATFSGAAALAAQSDEPPAVLRERVTSPGGTTHAALAALEAAGVGAAFRQAMHAAERRAVELGDDFGRD